MYANITIPLLLGLYWEESIQRLSISITARLLLAIVIAILGLTSPAFSQLDIPWFTVDAGGHTFSTGAAFQLGGTCGQSDAGSLSAGDYQLTGGFWLAGSTPCSVPEEPHAPDTPANPDLPLALRISAGLMNPFQHETGIRLELPTVLPVEICVFDLSGRLVRQLYGGQMAPGTHHLIWNGTSDDSRRVASNVYLLHIRTGDLVTKKRVVLLR